MFKFSIIYFLEYPIPNWVNDELVEVKENIRNFRYTTIGQHYRHHQDPCYFRPRIIHYLLSWIQILVNPSRYFPILRDYRKEVGLRIVIQTIATALILKHHKNVIIHCHFASSATTAALILHQLYGYQFSFTAHAWDIYSNTTNISLLKKKLISAYYVRAISEYNKSHLIQIEPECRPKIEVIHCGIPVKNFPYASKNLNRDTLIIISASNFVEKKGYVPFIETFEEIDLSEIRFQWKIAGQGPLKDSIESAIQKNNLGKYIELLPPVQHAKLNDFFSKGDIFLLPCTIASNGDRDGIPVILMEAMAAGIITISTPITGIPELIKHNVNGFLLKNTHARELIDIFRHIITLSQIELDSIRKNARDTIESNFNIQEIVKKHITYISSAKI